MSLSRRRFLTDCGVAAGSGLAAVPVGLCRAGDVDPIDEFLPCIDYPIRVGPHDPPFPTPVEIALELAEDGRGPAAGTPRIPWPARRALDTAALSAPRSPGAVTARGPARLAAMNRWRVDVLRVRFLGGSRNLHERVLALAAEWTPYSGIRFQASRDRDAEIRCGFQTNRLAPDGGHWSYVGIDSRDQVQGKSMNLAITEVSLERNSYHQAVVRHEFGHALGCVHEHQNPGRNGIRFDELKTIRYFRETYGWDAAKTNTNVLTRYRARELQRFSDFDPDSIMLYQYPAEITVDQRGTKQNYQLSYVDKDYMSKLYGVPFEPAEADGRTIESDSERAEVRELLVGAGPLQGAITPRRETNSYRIQISEPQTYTLVTGGYTQVVIKQLTDSSGAVIQTRTTTRDLANFTARVMLAPGRYQLDVGHRHQGGVGEYEIQLRR